MDFNKLIEGAVKIKASDIHLVEGGPPFLRVDGSVLPVSEPPVTHEDMEALLKAVMPERLRKRLEEKGAADFSYQYKDMARCRLVAYYERQKLRVTTRLISMAIPTIEELGLSPVLKKFKEFRFGLVLVTGPTGSGKTNTLAALISDINATHKHCIITIEDPIEFCYSNNRCIISQREVGADVSSFNDGLVQAMRQDPDVILVGEMRDRETVQTAIKASETGHLVLSTLHTTTAIQTIERVIGVFPQQEHDLLRDQLAVNLRAIIAQRLVRRAEGKGRIAVQEILINDMTIAKLTRENRLSDIYEVMKGGEGGMQVFDKALADLVRSKTITLEEGLVNARDEFAFKRFVKGVTSASDRGGIIGGFSG